MINFITTSFKSNSSSSVRGGLDVQKTSPYAYYKNLAPLKYDTVSFTSKNGKLLAENSVAVENSEALKNFANIETAVQKKTPLKDNRSKRLNLHLMHAFDNGKVCNEVYNNADFARSYLRKTLNSNLSSMTIKNDPKNGIIESIDTRIKTPESIREKIASVLSDAITSDTPYAFNPNLADEIKQHCGDLVGARIIMSKGSQNDGKKIIKALLGDIKNSKIKISSIENYVVREYKNGKEETISYFSDEDLKMLEDAVNEQRASRNLPPIEVVEKTKKSGYMALHLDVDLSSRNFKVKNNGYKGEIQILGYDVCRFKELEDLCYKITAEKAVKAEDPAYVPFINYFKQQMSNKDYPNLNKDFLEYTRRAYSYQKRRNSIGQRNGKYVLPSIKDCGMQNKIPPGLDFNILNRIKTNCDKNYEISKQYPIRTTAA